MCLRWRLNAGMPELDGGSSGRLTALSDEAHSYRVVGLGNRRLVLGLLHAEPDRCRGVVADGHFHGDGELVMTLSPEHPHHEPEPCRGCHHKSTERNQRCGRLGETAHLSRGCLRVIYERLNALRLQDVTTVRAWRSRIETTKLITTIISQLTTVRYPWPAQPVCYER